MSEGLGGPAVSTSLDMIAAGLDVLFEADHDQLSREEFLDLLRRRETIRRRDEALDHVLIAHATERGFAADLSIPSTRALLTGVLRISPREASRRVRAAELLGPRRALSGEPLAPRFPAVAAAQTEGLISGEHAAVITDMVAALPDPIRAEHGVYAEHELVEHAHTFHPGHLAAIARRLTAHLNPDGVQPDHAEKHRRRDVTLALADNGMGVLRGTLTPECLAMLQTALDPLAKPSTTNSDGADTRTPGQRRHDALHELARRLVASHTLPDTAGITTTLLVTVSLSDLEKRTGYGRTSHGVDLPIHELVKQAADSQAIPIFMTDTGGVLAYGRARRLATPAQRRALVARDRGCTFPTCDRRPAWCQPHHVAGWHPDGTTDIDNLALTCQHHNLEAERSHWTCAMIDGRPWWIPPPWIDPTQTPQRNVVHHINGP